MGIENRLIDGEIPLINSKLMKKGALGLNSRKISPYIARKKLNLEYNRKFSAYWPTYEENV